MSDSTQSREHYRLRYPTQGRPHFVLNGTVFTVTEISESGCRVQCDSEQSLLLHGDSEVVFTFNDGAQINSKTSFLRMTDDEVVLKLSPSIPLTVIIAEQHWVIRKFPRASQKTDP